MSKPQVIKFKTGLTLIYKYDKQREHSYVSFRFNSGIYNDPLDKLGLAHFTEHALFLGNNKYSKEDKSKIDHDHGYNAATAESYMFLFGTIADEEFDEQFGVLANWLTDFNLSQEDFDNEKKVILQEILRDREGISAVLRKQVRKDTYPQPIEQLGVETFGTVESVQGITRQDVIDNINKTIVQDNCIIVVYGNAKLDKVKKLINENIINSMPQTSGTKFVTSNQYHNQVSVNDPHMFISASPNGNRSRVYVTSEMVTTLDRVNARKCYLLDNIISSVAYNIFRDKYGLCYSSEALFVITDNETENWQLCKFNVQVDCDKANVQKVLEVMPEFYASLANYKVDRQSLEDSKKRVRCNKKLARPLTSAERGNDLMTSYVNNGRIVTEREHRIVRKRGDNLTENEVIDFEKQILMQKPYVYILANVDPSSLIGYDELTQKIADSLKWLNDYGPNDQSVRN